MHLIILSLNLCITRAYDVDVRAQHSYFQSNVNEPAIETSMSIDIELENSITIKCMRAQKTGGWVSLIMIGCHASHRKCSTDRP
jgi:hypothetical protein